MWREGHMGFWVIVIIVLVICIGIYLYDKHWGDKL
jgi:hypothetical protein